MIIKIICPVCNARNRLSYQQHYCRRCKEDLSLLYIVKAYSIKFRIYLAQVLSRQNPKKLQLASVATWLKKPDAVETPVIPDAATTRMTEMRPAATPKSDNEFQNYLEEE